VLFRFVAIVGLVALTPALVAAQDDQGWRDEHDRFRTWELVAIPVLFAPVTLHFLDDRNEADWHGGILFDGIAHDAFGMERGSGLDVARTIGDVTFFSMMGFPAVDALLTGLWTPGNWDVAGQMMAITLESYAVVTTLVYTLQFLVHRARPYDAECREHPDYDPDCGTTDLWRSFPSGHVAGTTTGAALICTHHLNLHTYGDPWDAVACGTAIALATYTAASRLFAKAHWLTDVLVGAVIGVFGGYVVPSALHYGF
jgi:membrane-associated phospholipid phosphatase